jgi:hypothetical protein
MFDFLNRYQRCQGAAMTLLLLIAVSYHVQIKPNTAVANQLQKVNICPQSHPFQPLKSLRGRNAQKSQAK